MSDQLLAFVSQYGAPALFIISAIAAVGIPLPVSLLLVVAGSLIAQGALSPWWAMAAASTGAILGDQAGYLIGRWGGTLVVARLSRILGKRGSLKPVEDSLNQWGGPGIFLSRWLVTAAGPWVNLASGTTAYPWPRFLLWDVLGEMLCAALFLFLGKSFSDRVMALYAVLGDLTWAILALAVALILGFQLARRLRRAEAR
jgi:membrane-associated protein